MRAAVFGDEQPGDLALDARGDDDRARLREGLHARGDIGRLAENFAGRPPPLHAPLKRSAPVAWLERLLSAVEWLDSVQPNWR